MTVPRRRSRIARPHHQRRLPLTTHHSPLTCSPTLRTNLAIRLLQIHMCVIYLFGGIAKMRGDTWWDGTALWYAFAQLEYQSLDMTWLVHYRWLLALLTHVTVFWETFYCFLIWPKLTRPLCLAMAVGVHVGIAVCLGMKTFGLVMIIGNLAFVYPETVRDVVAWIVRPFMRVPGEKVAAPPIKRQSLAVAATR
ncbi:MAG: HTTM domain-containing protein [Planctomycetia bacterium]|nr:HTTM domain-containing protein [Planctomycetia bacterium]